MTFTERVNEIVNELLPTTPKFYEKSKYVNDSIWGTIELFNYEQTIVDTPLFQRLRYIHQTGFTFFTFPTANHTRFEHSLGVANIATRIFNVLKTKHKIHDEGSLNRIRLAALLHDIGHSAFSHTTEEFYSTLEDILCFKKEYVQFESKGAGEVLSHLIVSSESFKKFFQKLKVFYFTTLQNVSIDEVANLIICKPKDENHGYEADIISGPIDADKLDYFPRDGRAVGIEISLDINRLIQCVEIQETAVYGEERKRISLVINRRGYNALQQLLFARASLTASVYHHHKVRACDSMLKNIILAYNDYNKRFNKSLKYPMGIELNSTPNFLLLTDFDFKYEVYNLKPDEIYYNLLNDLFTRNLFKRVLKISPETVITKSDKSDIGILDKTQSNYRAFCNLNNLPEIKGKMIEAILKESKISNLTKYDIAIDIPQKPNFEKAGIAPINTSSFLDKPHIVLLKEVIPIEAWIKGYETYFGHAYIFGPDEKEARIKLAIASAKVLSTSPQENIYKGFCLRPTYDAIAEDIRLEVKNIDKESELNLFRESK